jgi:hypothetical protein
MKTVQEQIAENAKMKLEHKNGMWQTTDGQRFYSERMATTVQIEIDLKINRWVRGGSDE